MQRKHAKPGLRVLDPFTAALTFVIGRKAVKGRHAAGVAGLLSEVLTLVVARGDAA